MRYLHIGGLIRAVSDDVARSWPEVEAQALRDAAREGVDPLVWIRTDARGTGTVPIRPDHPVTFTDEGVATVPELGVIVSASADYGDIEAEPTGGPPEPELTDEEVRELVRDLRNDRPHLDWDNILMGRLAGPATPDRPDVPVWEYRSFVDGHPEVRFSDLTAARFPVRHFGSPWDVTSIDEQLKPFPSSHKGPPPRARWVETADTIISRYAALHDAGVIEWDPSERGIVHVRPLSFHQAVLRAWVRTIDPPAGGPDPDFPPPE